MNVPAQRDDHGRLLPGFSGNPSGRPRVVAQIRDMALKAAPAAFEKVCDLVQSVDERIALAASQEILNRAYGKPLQSVDAEVKKFDMNALYLAATKLANCGDPATAPKIVDVTPLPDDAPEPTEDPATAITTDW
jgi:hypothetical protein